MKRQNRRRYESTFHLIVGTLALTLVCAASATAQNDQTASGTSSQQRSPEEARAELAKRGIKMYRHIQVVPRELRTAAIEGDLELVTLILDAGIHPNTLNDRGYTALHYGACNDRFEVMERLIERGAPARFEANQLVAACGYCGSELYRVAVARKARIAASEEEEGAAFSLYDAMAALQDRRRFLFQSIEVIGSFLLLIIAVTAVSLIILVVIAVVLALYLYLVFS